MAQQQVTDIFLSNCVFSNSLSNSNSPSEGYDVQGVLLSILYHDRKTPKLISFRENQESNIGALYDSLSRDRAPILDSYPYLTNLLLPSDYRSIYQLLIDLLLHLLLILLFDLDTRLSDKIILRYQVIRQNNTEIPGCPKLLY